MFREGLIDKTLRKIKRLIPKSVFNFAAPFYHTSLAYLGALIYGFPSRGMKVIGVTGTKGKSTVVYLISRVLEESGHDVAAIGSLGFKIKDKEWPNVLKMTMPGRFKLQKLLRQAKNAGCEYAVLEVTSEGIRQKRHLGIKFDCAVFTNLHREHIESHGSFENYYQAKQELFQVAKNIHVINGDDKYAKLFGNFHAKHKIFYGLETADMRAEKIEIRPDGMNFEVYGTPFNVKYTGRFNVLNSLAALSVGAMYGIDLPTMKPGLESVIVIPGRMEFIQREPFLAVVDYAHTPDSLEAVYKELKGMIKGRLICVLGAAGGGRDKWKRPEFGKIASQHCERIFLTDEDPFEEDPNKIIREIKAGISQDKLSSAKIIIDRKEAIAAALEEAKDGDAVVITGKGSEISMALAGGKKIPWSDKEIVKNLLLDDKK